MTTRLSCGVRTIDRTGSGVIETGRSMEGEISIALHHLNAKPQLDAPFVA